MMNQKRILISLTLSSMFLFLGCTGNEPQKENTKTEKIKTAITADALKYNKVVNKTISDCKEHGIVLDEGRTSKFVHRFPQADIDKIVTIERKLPMKNCQFFADETSVEKEGKVETLVSKAISECKKFDVTLNEQALRNRAVKIPLVIIRRMLETTNNTTDAECKEMALQFK